MDGNSSLLTPQAAVRGWPEALRDEPHANPFPWRVLLRWLLPGMAGAMLLLGLLWPLRNQAARPIVFFTAQGRLAQVRADGAGAAEIGRAAVAARSCRPGQAPPRVAHAGRAQVVAGRPLSRRDSA